MGVLVGDMGGTKTILALAEQEQGRLHLERELSFPSGGFGSLEDLVHHYLAETGLAPDRAAFAVAGPVQDGHSEITNLPWLIDSRHLAAEFGWGEVALLNDLEAVAWGIPALGPEDLAVLHPGEEGAQGNACVIAAGTGLGQAGLFWDGQRHHPFATEGG
nr:glucokinase [Chromatiaceae bacterium]